MLPGLFSMSYVMKSGLLLFRIPTSHGSTIQPSSLFDVTVTSTDPTESELIANTIAKVLPDRITDIVEGSSLKIVDYAIVPAHRSSPSYIKNTAIGVLLGGILAAAIIVISDMVRSSRDVMIHSADELKNIYPEIPVLAIIPDMRKNSSKNTYYYSNYYVDPGKSNEKNKRSEKNNEKPTNGKEAI